MMPLWNPTRAARARGQKNMVKKTLFSQRAERQGRYQTLTFSLGGSSAAAFEVEEEIDEEHLPCLYHAAS